jgi:NADH-dependent peroxiredoxin subunit F
MLHNVTLVLNHGEHEKRHELASFLRAIASASKSIEFEEREITRFVDSPISSVLETQGALTGIVFTGIPGGHEFNSLILAILQSGGIEIKLDDTLKAIIKSIDQKLNFEIFVSLDCQNCPEVVQTINAFALINDKITSEMIDGGLFQEVIDERNIRGVPSVYLNGELFANGRIDAAALIEKLIKFGDKTKNLKKSNEIDNYDLIVVGGGPAGISAAIYVARKGFNVLLIAQTFGGQLKDTLGIENFISVQKTTGPELSAALQSHLNSYGIKVRENLSVINILNEYFKKVILSSGETVESRSLIIATGAQWRKLDVPGEEENIGNGVAFCPHCDGPFFKNKDVAVIGGGTQD